MVRLMTIFLQLNKPKSTRSFPKQRYVDSLRIYVKGGAGGMGFPKFGGIGGKGGDVYVVADKNTTSLISVIKKDHNMRFKAEDGGQSRMYRVLGELGKDVEIKCPTGVTIYNDYKHKIGEIDKIGDRVLIANGGIGGSPDNGFNGQKGQHLSVTLDLKLIADIGLVGYPNAGKSSLLFNVSRASPKIASYPFTTLSPEIGVIEYDDFRQIKVADLPGLIEGAHANIGLGHRFLKHVERTKLILFVIDITGFQLSPAHNPRTPFESVVLLTKELELYKEELLDKPAILLINKMDFPQSQELATELIEQLKEPQNNTKDWPEKLKPKRFIYFDKIIPISAKTGYGLDQVKIELRNCIDLYEELKHEDIEIKDIAILDQSKSKIKLT